MSTGIDAFDSTIELTNRWLREIMENQGWDDRQRAYHALRLVLQALRDRLPLNEAVHLGAQLPMLLRGLYYEGWKPEDKPLRFSKDELLSHVMRGFRMDDAIDPESVVRTVFSVITRHVSKGEADDVKGALPKRLQELFPEEIREVKTSKASH